MKKLYRALVYLVTFAVPVVIAACYGVPYRFGRGGKVLDKNSRQPVSQIDLSCESSDAGSFYVDTTDELGEFKVTDFENCPELRAVDSLAVPGDAGVSDAGAADAGRIARYATKTGIPFGPDAGSITIELDRSN